MNFGDQPWMKPRATLLALIGLLGAASLRAENHDARGIVLEVGAAKRSLLISCDAIPGYMEAMEMPFTVRDPKALRTLRPGMAIRFTIAEDGKKLYAENIQPSTTKTFESEPMEAGTLNTLHSVLNPSASEIAVGQQVPDFTLTDQIGQQISLSQLRGRVVAVTFGYSRCPNPNYCFRLSNNLAQVSKRLHGEAGSDLILLTIAIDPEHDQGAALSAYAGTWKADPRSWHFLTGPLPEIKQVSGMFGVNFWSSEGALTHTLHTVLIDRQGKLAVNLEGNQFSSKQLGDLVETVIDRP
jgi:protein SCO1